MQGTDPPQTYLKNRLKTGNTGLETCARARCTPPSYVVHHRITLMELYRCTNFHVACSKYLEVRGLPTCTCVARAQCTTRPQIMYQRITLVKLFQCTKFRVASSKFPKSKGAYAYAKCTCIERALCTISGNDICNRITLIEFHLCTKFGVDSYNFPRPGGPFLNKLFRSWRAQSAPNRNGNHKSIHVRVMGVGAYLFGEGYPSPMFEIGH